MLITLIIKILIFVLESNNFMLKINYIKNKMNSIIEVFYQFSHYIVLVMR